MLGREQGGHQTSEGGADQSPVGCVAENRIKLSHPFFERTGKVGRDQIRIDRANQRGFISLTIRDQVRADK